MEQIAPRRYVDVPETVAADTRVVVLCGWAGAKIRYVKKYGAFYLDRGFLVFYIESEGGPLFNTNPKDKENLDFWAPIIHKVTTLGINCFGQNPASDIVLHAFSNGGVMQIWKLYIVLPKYESELGTFNLSSIIFDCAPGRFSMQAGISFINSLVVGTTKPGSIWYRLRTYCGYLIFALWLLPATGITIGMKLLGFGGATFFERNEQALYSERLRKLPRLFMYSKTDKLIEHQAVESHIKQSKEAGSSLVRVHVWEESEHVKLQMTQPERYNESLSSFLSEIATD
ncbi:hypothetical protein BJ742DRAFT_838244 [Cladochytrium replicatum]|nr:hypothetical protein BJ742DRAFT_838244 [Cladochytrium replicatum]